MKREPRSAVGQRAHFRAKRDSVSAERKMMGGSLLMGAGAAGLAANPLLGIGVISSGATIVDAGRTDLQVARRRAVQGNALDDLIARAQGRDLGARVRAAREQMTRDVAASAAANIKSAGSEPAAPRGRPAAAAKSRDGNVDAHTRIVNGRAVQVGSYSTPDRNR